MSAPAGFPVPDLERSPYTGWTRAHWEALLARMTYGYVLAAERSGSPARALYPDDRRGLSDRADAIESFARIASIWGAWLRNPANPACVHFEGRALDIEALLSRALLDGTNPANPYTYWGDLHELDQRLVESADLAAAVWFSRERVFNRFSPAEQAQVIAWLAQVDGKGTYYDNWVLFPAVAQAVRLRLGFPVPVEELDASLDQASDFYVGDGWYVDGPGDEYELYNAWMFNFHYLIWAGIDGDRRPEHCQRVLDRARSFQAGFPYFFGANGAYTAWGRSLVYRFAAVAACSTGHWLGLEPAAPGLLRRTASGCLRYFYEHGLFDPAEHYVRQGFHGNFPPAGEAYISPGSVYWCCHGLFALTLDAGDPFWTDTELPLPVEQGDFDVALPAPGLALSGRQATGQVLLLNGRSGYEYDGRGHNYGAKYGKFVYSTHFPFNVLPAGNSYAPDAMLALTRDGRAFGHRLRSRSGGVAPGLMWSRFDETLDGELQLLWVAILVWGDRQIRLAAIRPTFSVRAFEAPGALGCEQATRVQRRSDRSAGWEYAEAEGRAVGIRRLLGYDDQQASAPFRGHSNINLAYPYAEQPLVCESTLSMAPRYLAAISLVRPAPFDPERELAGPVVSVADGGIVQVVLPGGEAALVALRDHLPTSVTLAGAVVEGPGIRFARLKPDLTEVSGMGLERVTGIVDLAAPGSVRLVRQSGGVVRVTTDVGLALVESWLGGPARSIAVQDPRGAWVDVTGQCGPNTLPPELVRAWSNRNQRSLLEFSIRL